MSDKQKHAKTADPDDVVTLRFRDLIMIRAKAMGEARGWKGAVARELGIHPTHLSRILNGGVSVGWATAMEAANRLGISSDYFAEHGPRTEFHATPVKRPGQTAPRLVELRNAARAQLRKGMVPGEVARMEADGEDAIRLADMVLALDMVKLAREAKDDPIRARGTALLGELVRSFRELEDTHSEADFLTPEALAQTPEQNAMNRAMGTTPADVAAHKQKSLR